MGIEYSVSAPRPEEGVELAEWTLYDDQLLHAYLFELYDEHPDANWDDLPPEITDKVDDYLEVRLGDASICPVEWLVVELLLQFDDDVQKASRSQRPGMTLFIDVADKAALNRVDGRLWDYGYEQFETDVPEDEDSWVRVHYEPRRDAMDILGRMIGGGIDADTALDYWAGYLTRQTSSDEVRWAEWAELTGRSDRAPYRAYSELKSDNESITNYLQDTVGQPAPKSLGGLGVPEKKELVEKRHAEIRETFDLGGD